MPQKAPEFQATAFSCPSCEAYAEQRWGVARVLSGSIAYSVEYVDGALCSHCAEWSLWVRGRLVYPVGARTGAAPLDGMPESVRSLYEEARDVAAVSPRSAAALLRLALQVLVDDLESGAGSLNDKIGRLSKRGLNPEITRAMDVVRVIGNNSVHPGQIEVDEDEALIPALFALTNLIVEQVIVRAATVDALWDSLPEGARAAIGRRDGSTDIPAGPGA